MKTAKEARMETILNSEALKYMSNIEIAVNKAIEKGRMSATINHEIQETNNGSTQIVAAIKYKLEGLGYEVEFGFAKPKPYECPSSQWDYSNGYITINW